jgi:hypothetical protein
MKLNRLNCIHCSRDVKNPCFAGPPMSVLGHLTPNSTRGGITDPSGIAGPRVVFFSCKFGDAWRFKSSDRTICVCVSPHRGQLRLDADWYSTDLELAPHAADAIQSRWTAELGLDPKGHRGGECGGLNSCLIIDVARERELHWRRFLRRLLRDPASWRYFDWSVMDFRPPSVTAPNTSSGSQP